jgi:hypothetical protein
MKLVSGFPSIHRYFQADGAQPEVGSPTDFLNAFLRELCGVEPHVVRLGEKKELSTSESWGRVGIADTWLTWRAWRIVDDSSAYTEHYQADLPTIRFRWDVEFLKSGYRQIPRLVGLHVEFADPDTERMFRRLWKEVFRQSARFTRTTGPQAPDLHQAPEASTEPEARH